MVKTNKLFGKTLSLLLSLAVVLAICASCITAFAEEAKTFVDATGVDALAVAIGSAHGFYKKPPKLDIARLAEIHAATPVCLVLHGSSGIPHDQVREAIANGIVKVNLATEIKDTFMRALKGVLLSTDEIDLRKVFPKAVDPVVDLLCEKYRMTGAKL